MFLKVLIIEFLRALLTGNYFEGTNLIMFRKVNLWNLHVTTSVRTLYWSVITFFGMLILLEFQNNLLAISTNLFLILALLLVLRHIFFETCEFALRILTLCLAIFTFLQMLIIKIIVDILITAIVFIIAIQNKFGQVFENS